MSVEPKVIAIILNWNGASDTIELISSLQKIKYHNLEIIIVDNNSQEEDLQKIIRLFDNSVIIIKNDTNLGFTGGNNIGIEHALRKNPSYILLINNDCVVDAHFLNFLVNAGEDNKNIGIIGPTIMNYNTDDVQSCGGKINLFTGKVSLHKKIKPTNFISGACMLLKASMLRSVGIFDNTYFAYWEELDLSLRAIRENYSIHVVPESKIYHKTAQSSRYLSPFYVYYMLRNQLYFMKKNCQIYQYPSFLFFYLFRNVIGYLILIIPRNRSSLVSIFRGVRDGFKLLFSNNQQKKIIN